MEKGPKLPPAPPAWQALLRDENLEDDSNSDFWKPVKETRARAEQAVTPVAPALAPEEPTDPHPRRSKTGEIDLTSGVSNVRKTGQFDVKKTDPAVQIAAARAMAEVAGKLKNPASQIFVAGLITKAKKYAGSAASFQQEWQMDRQGAGAFLIPYLEDFASFLLAKSVSFAQLPDWRIAADQKTLAELLNQNYPQIPIQRNGGKRENLTLFELLGSLR